jgi:hypothetical protein
MKAIQLGLTLALFLILAAIGASALPLTIEKIEVDGTLLQPNEQTKLDIERGTEVDLDVYFTTTANIPNMEVLAFVSGFEYNDVTPTSDQAGPFDAEANTRYHKELKIKFSDEFEEDSYKIRVIFSDRNGEEQIANYNIKIDVPRHLLRVQDVILNPELSVKAGSALLAQVRLENKGEKEEEDIKVTVTMPELGVSATDYIDEMEDADHGEETEELYLRIPACAKPGVYNVEVTTTYGREDVKTTKQIQVTAGDSCDEISGPKTTITVGKQLETVTQGETGIYPITITNNQKQTKSYTLTIDADAWAKAITLTPASTVLVGAESSETIYIHATADISALGAKTITAKISSEGKELKQVVLTANVQKKPTNWIKLGLEAIIVIMAVLIILIAIVVGYFKLKDDSNEEEPKTKTYY